MSECDDTEEVQRRLLGSCVGFVLAFAFGASLLPLRSHISVSTAALVLVVPVVVGAVLVAGVAGGLLAVLLSF